MNARGVVAGIVIAAIVVGGFQTSPVFAQGQLAVVSPASVSSTIAAFPSGGPFLQQAISDLIYSNPDLAKDVANFLLSGGPGLNDAQKTAIQAGLADGLNRLGIIAQVGPDGGISPVLLALLAAGAIAGLILLVTKKSSCTVVSPNTTC